jgi:CelD/BcsL family acetyltransferase involved in cellulose biosynthesis
MISFELIDQNEVDWDAIHSLDECNIFQTQPWLSYLTRTLREKPIIIKIHENGEVLGYFTGIIIKKFGIRILASPLRGWTTYFMGFNLKPNVSRREILKVFPEFVFKRLRCHYFQIVDPYLKEADLAGLHIPFDNLQWFAIDLKPTEDEIFSKFKDKSCRRAIRRAIKKGVTVEEATDLSFADEYYSQFQEVLGKKGLSPDYALEHVKSMIEQLLPTGNLLLLRARNSEGICIATNIFLSYGRLAVGWGGASRAQYQHLNPNELVYWEGIKAMKARGAQVLHMGSMAEDFKLKFGAYDPWVFRVIKANNWFLNSLLQFATSPKTRSIRQFVFRRVSANRSLRVRTKRSAIPFDCGRHRT